MDKPINNDSPIMGNCLSCQGLVRVPATAPTSSTVKCPHCDESFRLSQILNHAVPELKIVLDENEVEDEVDEVAVKDADGRFVVANQLRQSSKKSRRRKKRRSRRPDETEGMIPVPKPLPEEPKLAPDAMVSESDLSPLTVSDSQSGSPRESFDSRRSSGSGNQDTRDIGWRRSASDSSRRRSSSRGSRSRSSSESGSSNVAVEILKVVLGGAMAIPIAYLLVLWVFKQDPLHVAPKIVRTAPFLLPTQFRSDEDESTKRANDDFDDESIEGSDRELVEDILDVSSGLPKPRRDPGKVGIN